MIEDRSQAPKPCIGMAVAAIIFLFPTFMGIPALIRAIKARQAVARGDIETAWSLTDSSKRMSKIGLIVGIIFMVVFLAFYIWALVAATRHSVYNYYY